VTPKWAWDCDEMTSLFEAWESAKVIKSGYSKHGCDIQAESFFSQTSSEMSNQDECPTIMNQTILKL